MSARKKKIKSAVREGVKTYDAVGDESHCVGRNETLLVHPLSTVPPVLNYSKTQSQKLDGLHYVRIILTFHLGGHYFSLSSF